VTVFASAAFKSVEGQPTAVRVLEHAIATGRIAQAYLFAGPDGVGKQRAAFALARAVLCDQQGCGQCAVCTRIDSRNHPDVRVFAPRDEGDRNLQVEYLRSEILPLTKFAPFEGRAAFFIFPEADLSFPEQHAEAANALLKTLEEPRPNVSFILMSARPDSLLATIRSRCQRVRFNPLPADVIERILEERGVSSEARRTAAALAGGSASRALALTEEDRAQRILDWALRIDAALGSEGKRRDAGAVLEIAEELSRSDDMDLVLESLAMFYRDVAGRSLGLSSEALYFDHPATADRAQTLSVAAAADRASAVSVLFDGLRRNANPQIALDGFLLGLR
jgi:DNA polymerase-3 subunit delta'